MRGIRHYILYKFWKGYYWVFDNIYGMYDSRSFADMKRRTTRKHQQN